MVDDGKKRLQSHPIFYLTRQFEPKSGLKVRPVQEVLWPATSLFCLVSRIRDVPLVMFLLVL